MKTLNRITTPDWYECENGVWCYMDFFNNRPQMLAVWPNKPEVYIVEGRRVYILDGGEA